MKERENGNGAIPAPPEGFTLIEPQKAPPPPAGFSLVASDAPKAPQKAGGFGGIASEVGKMLYDLPVQAVSGFAQALEGTEPYSNTDWKDEAIQAARTRHQERLAEPGADTPLPFGLTGKDFRDTGASLGFTAVSAGAGVAAGVPAAIAAGPVAGYAAGGFASGGAAHQMAANSFVRSIIEAEDEESIQKTGTPLTDEQKRQRQAEIQDQAGEYGLWEAIPEAVGNVAGLKIIATPLKKMLGKNVAARVMSKLGGLYGTELATETVTQMGQNNVEAQFDAERERRSFSDPAAYLKSLKEVMPQVFILTTLMGGAGTAGVAAYRRGVEDPRKATAYKNATADPTQLRAIPDKDLDSLLLDGEDLIKRRKKDDDLKVAVDTLKKERDLRKQRAEILAEMPGTEGIQVQGEAYGAPEEIDLGGFQAPPAAPAPGFPTDFNQTTEPFPSAAGIQVQETSVIQDMAARLRDRVQAMKVERAFGQAERDQAAQKESDLGRLAARARQEREQPSLDTLAANARQRLPDVLGRRAELERQRAEAQPAAPEQDGIQVDEETGPRNTAMADALRQAGAVGPEEIRPKSGNPYKTEASARNIIKIRKLKGFEPVEVDGGWVLQKAGAGPAPAAQGQPAPTAIEPTPTGVPEQVTTPAAEAADTIPQETVSEPETVAEPATVPDKGVSELEQHAKSLANIDQLKSWARGRYGNDTYKRMLESGEIGDAWNRARGKAPAAAAAPKPEKQAQAFTATHELPDGTLVRAVEGEKGVYVDSDGQEYEEPNATEVSNAQQVQAEKAPAAASAAEEGGVKEQGFKQDPYDINRYFTPDQEITLKALGGKRDGEFVGVWRGLKTNPVLGMDAAYKHAKKLKSDNTSREGGKPVSDKPIGQNAQGEDIFEDEKGVRYVKRGNIRINQKVELRPTRAGMKAEPVPEDRFEVAPKIKTITVNLREGTVSEGDYRRPVDKAASEAATSPKNDTQAPTQAQQKVGINGMQVSIENPAGSWRYKIDEKRLEHVIDELKKADTPAAKKAIRQIEQGLKILRSSAPRPKIALKFFNQASVEITRQHPPLADVIDEITEAAWAHKMAHHYGYFLGTVGPDKDHVDVFLGPNAEDPAAKAFIVDQVNQDGSFDEPKVMLGFPSVAAARNGYLSNYEKGWTGLGAITEFSVDSLKAWLADPVKTKKPAAAKMERRKDLARRKRVDQMTEAEMRRELLTDTLTGLGNRRAYDEALADQPDATHAYMDVDALKWVNDNMGHTSGDELLKAMGEAVKEALSLQEAVDGPRATGYHLSGDEFVILADTPEAAEAIAIRAQEVARSAEIEYTGPDGSRTTKTGVEFSYGIGQDLKTADTALQRNKAEREAAGLRAPRGGIPAGVVKESAEGRKAEVQGAAQQITVKQPGKHLTVSKRFTGILDKELQAAGVDSTHDDITIHFRDPKYSAKTGGYHPVEVAIQPDGTLRYITDYTYAGPENELVKEIDFDFENKIFGHNPGGYAKDFPLIRGRGLYKTWQSNFSNYYDMGVFEVEVRSDKLREQGARPAGIGEIPGTTIESEGIPPAMVHEGLRQEGWEFQDARTSDRAYKDKAGSKFPTFERDGVRIALRAGASLSAHRGTVEVYDDAPKTVVVEALLVDADQRRNGKADAALSDLTRLADLTNSTLYLEPAQLEKGGAPKAALVALYRKHGFVSTTEQDLVMKREPNANPVQPDKAKSYGKSNKVFTEDAAARARELLKKKLGNLNAGIDPEILQAGLTLAGYHIEAGARAFADYAKAMVADLGESVRPYLRSWYESVRHYPGFDNAGMTPVSEIETAVSELATMDQEVTANDDRRLRDEVPPSDAGASASDVQRTDAQRQDADASEREGRGSEPAADGTVPGIESGAGRISSGSKRVSGGRRTSAGSDARVSAGESRNFVIEAGGLQESRGWAQKARDNIRAIEIVRQLDAEARPATDDEQAALSLYVGWGGMSQAFPDQNGEYGKGFEKIGPQIRDLLSDSEYDTARRSIQYAHYTSEPVIRAMWKAAERLGFKGGKVFEPGMGIGHFAGIMPQEVAAHTEYNGLELDHTTAKIAKALYPKWGIRQDDFTKSPLPADTYDLVIGNPPFADIAIKSDPKYAKHGFLLHDYFFAKSLDAVRPGGLLMFISSAGTLNKADSKARAYLAERADLVGAFRLPSDAFKQNAGTEVTTDIIILRKKNDVGSEPWLGAVPAEWWVESEQTELPDKNGDLKKGNVSPYFNRRPQHVLGIEGFTDKLYLGRYAVQPNGTPLNSQLAVAIDSLPEKVMSDWRDAHSHDAVDFAATEKKDGSFYLSDNGALMQYSDGVGREVPQYGKGPGGKSKADMERIRGLIPVRDALRDVFSSDLNGDSAAAEKSRARLNKAYDDFVAKHGPINLAKISYRRPTRIQSESARNEAREEARYAGQQFNEGSFDPRPMIAAGKSLADISRARVDARESAKSEGLPWDEGSFNPDDMPDEVIDKRPNIDPFMDDPESYRLRSIEHYDDATGKSEKGLVFSRNILTLEKEPEINGAGDALFHVLDKIGYPDVDAIARSAGMSKDDVLNELGDSLFEVPGKSGVYETRDDYLSGNVRQKLREAEKAASKDAKYRRNVDALLAAQPDDLPPSLITANLGMPWIPAEVYQQFGTEVLGLQSLSTFYQPKLGEWIVSGDEKSAAAVSTYGTERMPAPRIIYHAMNRITPKIFDTWRDASGTHRELNKEDTEAALLKVRDVKDKFTSWIYEDSERADRLAGFYNEQFNSMRPWEGDGGYLTTPGVASDWKWRPHQTRVIARILRRGNTYMGHAVGAGKTSAMIGAGMEMRRLGLARKPMYSVPNHMLAQFTKEFYEQYPTARIMVADERRFHTNRRRQFISDVATQDLDAVIITHSAFGKIPMSAEFQDQVIQEQIDSYREILEELGDREFGEDSDKRITRKRVEKAIERLEQRLSGKMQGNAKDQVFTFEEMGIDFLFIDEAHLYRKLDFATRMSGVKGVSPEGSQAAMDLYTKLRFLRTKDPERHAVLASGTPITNTMAELYSVSRYMQEDTLVGMGLEAFDAWAAAFGDTVTELEQDAAGGYKPQTRFAQFVNVPELSAMVRQIMDVVTSKELEQYVTRPAIKGGQRQLKLAEKSDALDEYQKTLAARMTAIEKRKGPPKKGDDILLSVINDGRHAAIDMRFVDPNIGKTDPPSKLDMLVDDVFETWQNTDLQPLHRPESGGYSKKPVDHGPATQMVFANLGVGEGREFNTYRYIVSELAQRGVPRDQIAIISDYKTHVARQRLFNDMNEGKVRILIGSTQKMATGVNAQRRLYAINNLDPLWYPADDEQRIGRGLRQGNMNPEIEIRDYSTKGTYDSQMWNLMEKKARFIEGFFRGDPSMRNMEDLGEASQYAQAKAMTTNDPRLIELTDLRQKIETELRRKSAFETETYNARRRIARAEDVIESANDRIFRYSDYIARRVDVSGEKFKASVGGKQFSDREEFGKALWAARKEATAGEKEVTRKVIGSLAGFEISVSVDKFNSKDGPQYSSTLYLDFDDAHYSDIHASSSIGLVDDAEQTLSEFENRVENARYDIEKARKEIADFTPRLSREYESSVDVKSMVDRAREIEGQLETESQAAEAAAESAAQTDRRDTNFSLAPQGAQQVAATVDGVQSEIDALLNPSGRKAMGDILTVVQSDSDLPASLQHPDGGVRGVTDPATGKVYLVADNLGDNAKGVFLHEVGVHYGLRELLGDRFGDVLAQMRGLRTVKNKAAQAAYAKVPRDTARDRVDEEALAYLVEDAAARDMGIVRKVIAAVRAFLFRQGFLVRALTPDDMLAMASAAARKAVSGRVEPAADVGADPLYSRITENAQAIYEAQRSTWAEKGGALWDSIKEAASGPLGNLPGVDTYLKTRYQTLGRIAEIDEGAKAIYEAFANAGDDIPAVYEFLTSREATPQAIRSRVVRDKAVEVKGVLEDIGQQLVDRGLLSEEAFENNRGQYLPRIYLKHLLRDSDIALIGTGKKPSDLGYLKQRKDIPEEIRRLILGEITDPGYLASKGFGQQSRDIALLDWLGKIASNRDWVWQQSLVDWSWTDRNGVTRTRRATPFWLMAEADRLRAQAHYLDVDDARASRTLAERMEEAGRSALDDIDTSNIPNDFKQMPNSPRYGSMRGLIVRKEIYNDIVGTLRITTGDESFAEKILGHGGLATKATQLWKWPLALDTRLPTPTGWTTMGEVQVGDRLFDEHGRVCDVLEVKEVLHGRECFEVGFSDGAKIVADRDHLWFVLNSVRDAKILTTGQIMDTLTTGPRGDHRHSVPVTEALILPDVDLPIPPYALGVWLGDGCSGSARVCAGKDDVNEIIDNLERSGVRCSEGTTRQDGLRVFAIQKESTNCLRNHDPSDVRPNGKGCLACERERKKNALSPVTNPDIPALMRDQGILDDKHIPSLYLRASKEQRMELLRGLMDTDGWADKNRCSFGTSNPRLRDDVVELLRSLGYKPVVREHQPTNTATGKQGKTAWKIQYAAYADEPVFHLERKRDRLAPAPKTRQRSRTRQIVSVTPVPSVPVRCIGVSSRSELFLAGDGFIPTHNSKVAANPPAQIRNFVSNGVLLHLSGVPFHKVPLRVIQAVKQIRARAQGRPASEWKHYDVARRYGVTESTFSAQELIRMERDLLALEARNANKISMATLKHLAGIVMDKTGDWYQFAEGLFKTAKIIDAMERQGKSEGDAALEAQKWLFDYSLIGPSTRYLRNAPVGIPFLTFHLKALPRMLEVARTAPWRFAPYVALPYVLTSMVAGMADVDDDDVKALQKALPDWLQSRGHAYVLPIKDDSGRWQAMDFGYFLPWTMWTSLVSETANGDIGDAMMTSGVLGGPLPDLIAAIQTNRDPFTGRDIINEADPPGRQIVSMLSYLYGMAMPTWLTNYGAVGHLLRAGEGEVDRYGLPKTGYGQAAARLVGVNLYPIDPETSRSDNLRRMRFEIGEISRRMRQQLRNPNLSAEDRTSVRDEYLELIRARMEQMAKYGAESKVHPNLRRE